MLIDRLQTVMESAESLLIDIPMLWSYLSELIVPIIQFIGLSFLAPSLRLVIEPHNQAAFVRAILTDALNHVVSYISIVVTLNIVCLFIVIKFYRIFKLYMFSDCYLTKALNLYTTALVWVILLSHKGHLPLTPLPFTL